MKDKGKPKNVASSVRARLGNLAKREKLAFDSILLLYFQERFLARLASSQHADRFVLKGALLFFVRGTEGKGMYARPTKDIDLLGLKLKPDLERLREILRAIAEVKMDDGVEFDPDSVTTERIKEEDEYQGVRGHVVGRLGQARARLQVDIGFGDVVTPEIQKATYPVLLDAEPRQLWCYSWETVIAEKLQAMVSLGSLNSRMKDFFDVYQLANTKQFDGALLQRAVQRTFVRRGTPFDRGTIIFSDQFSQEPGRQAFWAGFRRRVKVQDAPEGFEKVMQLLSKFVAPIYFACCDSIAFHGRWSPQEAEWFS